MTVAQLKDILDAKNLTPGVSLAGEVSCGYVCDLLSWVMAHGMPGTAWVTVQTHLNVVAVAVLMEFSCILIPEDIDMEESTLLKAQSENIPVLKSRKTAFQICGEMAAAGIPASAR
jgi:hypothetical protein